MKRKDEYDRLYNYDEEDSRKRFDKANKTTWWGEVDPWLTDSLYLNPGFKKYFDERSEVCSDGLYPTVTIRQIMWALKTKPMQKQ